MKVRIYLRAGDRVHHLHYTRWGHGKVVEEKHSSLDGGTCMVRILFEDGKERSFLNNLENSLCCYHAGIRLI